MQRTSNCFDLASVLIKPVQRILKYPLLINELEKATEDSHPDKQLLLQAMDNMSRVCTSLTFALFHFVPKAPRHDVI